MNNQSQAMILIALCLRFPCTRCGAPAGQTCSGSIYLERGGNVHEERAGAAAGLERATFAAYDLGWIYDRIRDLTYVGAVSTKTDRIVAWMATAYRRQHAHD